MKIVKAAMAVLSALAALLMVAGCTSSGASKGDLNDQVSNSGSSYEGFGMDPPLPRPSFTLTDTDGQPFSFSDETSGAPTLLYFGYTDCPDVCPTTMADIATALRHVPAKLRDQVKVVFVTTDVKHDTGPVIASWLRNLDTGLSHPFIGLTGTQDQIDAAQAAAHVTLATDDGKQHAATVYLYAKDNYAHVSFAQNDDEAGQIQHDLQV